MNRALHPINEVKNIAYLSGGIEHALNSPLRVVALMGRPVNRLSQGCSCYATGSCPTCRAYASILEGIEQRRAEQW